MHGFGLYRIFAMGFLCDFYTVIPGMFCLLSLLLDTNTLNILLRIEIVLLIVVEEIVADKKGYKRWYYRFVDLTFALSIAQFGMWIFNLVTFARQYHCCVPWPSWFWFNSWKYLWVRSFTLGFRLGSTGMMFFMTYADERKALRILRLRLEHIKMGLIPIDAA